MSVPLEIAPSDVRRRIDAGETLQLIDVREPFERAIATIEGSEIFPLAHGIPFDQLEQRAVAAPLIVFCHHGVRSLNVVQWLRQRGIENCQSMSGGIDAWSREIDPSVPQY
jgi:rhodanese-related sulfurtransferase